MNTFNIRTKQHKKRKKNRKTAIYSLAYIYIKQVVYTKSTAEHCGINTVLNIYYFSDSCENLKWTICTPEQRSQLHWVDIQSLTRL